MQLIFDVASGLKGLGLLADLCGLHSAPRGRDFEIKAIKHARSHHPKTKYSLRGGGFMRLPLFASAQING